MNILSTCLLALVLSLGWLPAAAQQELQITGLTSLDREFMHTQRTYIDDLARGKLGRQLNGQRNHDLVILQDLLDRRLVRAEQPVELQAMGMVLGDLLAEQLGMHWVIYLDELGRSRALRMPDTDHYLFPVTMISRRAEVGAPVDVQAIYSKAYELMSPHKPKLPFQ